MRTVIIILLSVCFALLTMPVYGQITCSVVGGVTKCFWYGGTVADPLDLNDVWVADQAAGYGSIYKVTGTSTYILNPDPSYMVNPGSGGASWYQIGNASVASYFDISDCQVYMNECFLQNSFMGIYVNRFSKLTTSDTHYTINHQFNSPYPIAGHSSLLSYVEISNCLFTVSPESSGAGFPAIFRFPATNYVHDSIMPGFTFRSFHGGISNVTIDPGLYQTIRDSAATIEDVTIKNINTGGLYYTTNTADIIGLKTTGSQDYPIRVAATVSDLNLINCDLEIWSSQNNNTCEDINRIYTVDISVTDDNGDPVSGVSVNAFDRYVDAVWTEDSIATGSGGTIEQQELTRQTFWDNNTGGGWTVSDVTEYSPHRFEFKKKNKRTHEISGVTVYDKIDWAVNIEALLYPPAPWGN